MAERTPLEVGRIVKPHGLRGQVVVELITDRTERVAVGSELLTDRGPLVVRSAIAHQNRFLVQFDRIEGRDGAEAWRGVVLRAEPLEDEDAIWIDDLFGARVIDQHGIDRGRVVEVEANPASDLLVLEDGALVPLSFVTEVVAHETVRVEVPEGLFE